MKNTRQAFI